MTTYVAGDTDSTLEVKCLETDTVIPINLKGCKVELRWINKAKQKQNRLMDIVNPAGGIVSYQFKELELEHPYMTFDVVITLKNGKKVTGKDMVRLVVRDPQ